MLTPRFFFLLSSASLLITLSDSVNVLIFSPGFSNSHTIFSQRLAKSLLSEHHDVTVWTSMDKGVTIKDPPDAARQIAINFDLGEDVRNHFQNIAFLQNMTFGQKAKGWNKFFAGMSASCKDQLEDGGSHLARLKKEHFDLAIVPVIDYCALLLGSELRIKKYVFINAGTYIFDHVAHLNGIPLMPSFIPIADSSFSDRMSFTERMFNAMQSTMFGPGRLYIPGSILFDQYYQYAESMNGASPSTPDFFRFIRDSSVGVMINGDSMLNFPRPLAFDTFYLSELGDIQDTEAANPLEPKFDALMKNGPVVVVSFGTIARPSAFPKEWILGLVEGLGRLSNYTVIWKFDIDIPEAAQYPHIHLVPWLPQRDLLKHPNTKLFVTHAGYNSLLESTKAGIPMLLIPLFVDQFCNAVRAVRLGLGVRVFKNEISGDSIFEAASEVLHDQRFAKRAKSLNAMMSDKLISAEKALSYRMKLWSKHSAKRLPRLYAARNMNVLQLYCIDVIVFWSGLLALCVYIIAILLRMIYRLAVGSLLS